MLNIKLDNNGVTLEIEKNGEKFVKPVDYGELAAMLNENAVHDSGMLPPNTRHVSVRGNMYSVVIEIPPGRRNLSWAGSSDPIEVVGVSVPASLFFFQLIKREGKFYLNQAHAFALKGDRLLFSKDVLYAFPFPNVYPEDDKICWGENNMKAPLKSLAGIEGFVRTYFGTPFNSDLFDYSKLSKDFPWKEAGNLNIRKYFKFLAENSFNTDWLVPSTQTDFASTIKKLGR